MPIFPASLAARIWARGLRAPVRAAGCGMLGSATRREDRSGNTSLDSLVPPRLFAPTQAAHEHRPWGRSCFSLMHPEAVHTCALTGSLSPRLCPWARGQEPRSRLDHPSPRGRCSGSHGPHSRIETSRGWRHRGCAWPVPAPLEGLRLKSPAARY